MDVRIPFPSSRPRPRPTRSTPVWSSSKTAAMFRTSSSRTSCFKQLRPSSSRSDQPTSPPRLPETTLPPIGTIHYQDRRIAVSCRIGFDGVEYVGHLWFAPEDGTGPALPDRAAIPGRSRDDVLALAQRLTSHEL